MAASKLLLQTIDAAEAAGKVLLKYFEKNFEIREKMTSKGKSAGLVSIADIQAEAAALKILKKAKPEFEILAEESSPTASKIAPKDLPGRWIIDPLDGTTNFVHGFPMFCVSIAAEVRGETQIGVIYHPILKDLYWAEKGKGAFLNKKKISVSKRKKMGDALLTTGFTYAKDEWLNKEMGIFEKLSRKARAVRRPGSAALDLAYTARGVFDGYWERQLSPWDVAAGALLVQEAGGKVTDFYNDQFQPESRQILATNGSLHPLLLEIFHK